MDAFAVSQKTDEAVPRSGAALPRSSAAGALVNSTTMGSCPRKTGRVKKYEKIPKTKEVKYVQCFARPPVCSRRLTDKTKAQANKAYCTFEWYRLCQCYCPSASRTSSALSGLGRKIE